MTDQTTSGYHPSLQAFIDALIHAGHGPTGVRRQAAYLSAMANRLKVAPADLPDDAVALHFAGRSRSTASAVSYSEAHTRFKHYLAHGLTPRLATRDRAPITDPDIRQWDKAMSMAKAVGTRRMYTQVVGAVAEHVDKPAREITKFDVIEYISDRQDIARLRNKPLSNRRKVSILTAVRNFCKDMELKDVTETIPRARVDAERTPPISRTDLAALAHAASALANSPDTAESDTGRMWTLAIKLMAFNGLRIGEVTGFNPSAKAEHYLLAGAQWELALHTAKGRDGMGARHIEAADAVISELQDPYWHNRITVFPPHWDAETASVNFKGFARLNGIITRAHRLRAFYASEFYVSSNYNILGLQKQMGHKEIETTMGYVKLGVDPVRSQATASFGMEFLPAADRAAVNRMRRDQAPVIPDSLPIARPLVTGEAA